VAVRLAQLRAAARGRRVRRRAQAAQRVVREELEVLQGQPLGAAQVAQRRVHLVEEREELRAWAGARVRRHSS
jgi:hypothetical protein